MHNNQNNRTYRDLYILCLAIVAAIAGLLFGFDLGIISGALPFISHSLHIAEYHYQPYFILGFIPTHSMQIKEAIVSAVPFGALLGAILSAKAAHNMGRRKSIICTGILFFAGTLMASLSHSINTLIFSRLIMGFAVGLSATIVPMYLSEVSPPRIRGAVIFLYQMAITIGIFLSAVINYFFSAGGNWRAMFLVGLAPSALLTIGMLFLPHSPRWLMVKGKQDRARRVLKQLRRHQNIDLELQDIANALEHKKGGLKLLFNSTLRPLVIIAFGLFVFQQLTGINTIFYYAPTIFQKAGFVGIHGAMLASLYATGINVIATLFGIWLVDIIGRRKLLCIGLCGIIICLTTMGASYSIHNTQLAPWITLIAAMSFIAFFATSISGISYIVMSEIFPLHIRGSGMAVASCANWGFNWLVAATFLSLTHSIGISHSYFLYAFFSFIGLFFVLFLVPETKGVPLEKIEENLYAGCRSRDLGQTLTDSSHAT